MKLTLTFLLASALSAYAAPVISEIVADNNTGLQDEDEAFVDWIELYNPEDAPFDLAGYFLTDSFEDQPERWTFPAVTMSAYGYLIVYASGKNRRSPDTNLHTNFKLTSGGESLSLVNPDGAEIIDSITFPPLETDHSHILLDGGYADSNSPTPGEPNATNVVLFSIKGQAFTENVVVELTAPGGQAIKYTEDGKRPSLFNGKSYSGPITVNKTTLLAAVATGGPLVTEAFIQVDPELANRDSDIPIVIADASTTLSQTTMKEMIFAVIEPSNNGRARLVSEFQLSTRGGIRTRGETSNSFPKKPLRIEFWDENGDDRPLSPLGMPGEADWVLNARYDFDRTLMHNTWIYELSNELGEWAPHTRFVELYLNDNDDPVNESDYNGVYTFVENIQRGKGRVNVETMEIADTAVPEITGGYLFRKDKTDPNTWNFSGGGESLQMIYPREEEQTERVHQGDWISNYLDTMRDAIRDHGADPEQGYPAFIDEGAWHNHHQLNFLTNNVDALRLSAYFYLPRGGKLTAGPAWDFDRSAGGPSDGRIADPLQWGDGSGGTAFFERGNHGTPVWWEDLFADPDFMQNWVDRWYELRQSERVTPTWDRDAEPLPAFSDANIARIFDHMAGEIQEAQERNFAKWTGARPRTASQLKYSDVGGFEGEIEHIKGWLKARAEWIENELIYVPSFTPKEADQSNPFTINVADGGTLFKPAITYYTTDGTDPRQSGGETNPNASQLNKTIILTQSSRVLARRVDDSYTPDRWGPSLQWSGPGNHYFFVDTVPANATNLVVSEIMYHPSAPSEAEIAATFDDADDFEFIEFRNISSDRVDLSEARLRGDADFNFPDGTVLEPGEHAVIVANQEAFIMRYGEAARVLGDYSNRLGNGSGTIRLRDYQRAISREINYDDQAPWPEEAGNSLVLTNPESNPDANLAMSWTTAASTPGTSDGGGGNPVETGYEAWLKTVFTSDQLADAAVSGIAADTDHDGLATLAEYVLTGDPKQPDSDKLPTATLAADGTSLQLSYVRRLSSGITIDVELSGDLTTWTIADAATVTTSATALGNDTESATTTIPLTGASNNHARLRVTLP
jgi:hypothetical protein